MVDDQLQKRLGTRGRRQERFSDASGRGRIERRAGTAAEETAAS